MKKTMDVLTRRQIIAKLRKFARRIRLFWGMYWMYWKLRTWLENKRNYIIKDELADLGKYGDPDLAHPVSQLCTARQFYSDRYKYWCVEMDSPPRFARKQWEFVYIMEALSSRGKLVDGAYGLGFGCGREPMPGVFAKRGCDIVATDLDQQVAKERGWVETLQHSNGLKDLYAACNEVIDEESFNEKVSFINVDMNAIPLELSGFDFVWSACALEHLGSLKHGIEFVKNSIKCLKPGGVAVHTTEFNLSSNEDTFETEGCSVYRKKDIELLVNELEAEGYKVEPVNYNSGHQKVDMYIDIPPYGFSPHLKLLLDNYVITSIGIIIMRPEL